MAGGAVELALEELARARDFSERSKTDLRDRAVKGPAVQFSSVQFSSVRDD